MLQFLREKTTGWIAIAILILLSIPFAFFGMEQYLFQRNATWVAKVEAPPTWWRDAPAWWPASMLWQHEEITADDFRTAFDEARRTAREQQGEMFDPRQFESVDNKRAVLERLIDERLMAMSTRRNGMLVSNTQIQQIILSEPSFQIDGKFDAERYRLALAAGNPPRTPAQFDAFVRQRMQQSLLPIALMQSSFTTGTELDRLLRLSGETRDVSFFLLRPAPDTSAVDEAQAKAWYDSHVADYRLPETVTLDYIEFDSSNVPPATPPSDAELRSLYEQQKARFGSAPERQVSHILVQVPADADAATQQAAQAKANGLATQARAAGADFAALARENSDDAGSRTGGGDLGWIGQDGSMAKPFEDAVFQATPGSIVGPIRTDFGWHVIQVREARDGSAQPFEAVREQLVREQAETAHERAYNDALSKLVDEVYKNPTTLEPAARAGGVQIRQLGPISRNPGPEAGELANNPLLLREAFSDTLIQDGIVSDPIEIAPGRNVLIRVNQHTPASTRPLEQVRDHVIAAVRADRARKALEADGDALLADVRGGKTMDAAAASRGVEAMHLPAVPRNAPLPDAEASRRIFSAPAPAEGKISADRVTLADGNVMLFAISKVTPGDAATATEAERSGLRQQLAQISAMGEAEALRKALRQRFKVSVEESRL